VPGCAVLFAGIVLYYIGDTPEGETIRREVTEKRGAEKEYSMSDSMTQISRILSV